MKKGKFIMAAFALLALLFIGGTVAYFTDTDSATNTFTLGSVDITLTEPTWTSTGATEAANNILPGAVIHKDPTVTNVGKSDAYVFIKLTVPCYDTTEAFTYTPAGSWALISSASGSCTGTGVSTIDKVYAYGSASALTALAGNDTAAPALFTTVTLNDQLTQDAVTALSNNTNGHQIVVNAYAIQKDNVSSDPATAWANFGNGSGY